MKIKEIEKKERFKLESNVHKKLQKVEELHMKVDSFEQDQYKSSIQIVGFPESQDDTKALIKLSKEKLGVKFKSGDIASITHLGKQQNSEKPRNIVVKFNNELIRNQVYQQRKKLVTSKDPKRNVYVNDRLTDHRQNVRLVHLKTGHFDEKNLTSYMVLFLITRNPADES